MENNQNQNKINRINNIFSGIKNKKETKNKPYKPEDIDKVHHMLMKHYGWIPIEELMKLTDYQMFTMMKHCQEEDEKELMKFRILIKSITGKDIGK